MSCSGFFNPINCSRSVAIVAEHLQTQMVQTTIEKFAGVRIDILSKSRQTDTSYERKRFSLYFLEFRLEETTKSFARFFYVDLFHPLSVHLCLLKANAATQLARRNYQ